MVLDDLKQGQRVRGIGTLGPVTIEVVNRHGADAVSIIYTDSGGGVGRHLLSSADAEHLELAESAGLPPLDANANEFKLAAESLRIRLAWLYDPLLAVNTSAVEPLHHQISAVYDHMLPRQPLRFLLADDPGARASDEYRDPRTFYGRTYITEGLGSLVRTALRRLSGKAGEPVVQLQTNFGGGRTYSMLALYHLTEAASAQELPGVDQFLAEEGLSMPRGVRRAVIVGNKIQPGSVDGKPDGTEVRTLWGEIAWQLGGKTGYEMVRSADEQATSPGDALTSLMICVSVSTVN